MNNELEEIVAIGICKKIQDARGYTVPWFQMAEQSKNDYIEKARLLWMRKKD